MMRRLNGRAVGVGAAAVFRQSTTPVVGFGLATSASPCGTSSAAALPLFGSHGQVRSIQWDALNPSNWNQKRRTNPNVEEELPEVFAEQPQEVDDYIRPEKTFFEKLEDWWDWAIGFFAPVDKQIELMKWVREVGFFGVPLDYGGIFFMWGVCLRLLSLGPQLYVHRNGLRLAKIGPQLSEIAQLQKKVKADKSISTADKRVIKEGYDRMKKALHKKHGCSQMRSMASAITSPFMMSTFLAIRRLATYDETLETTSFLWVTDLTMPDPTWALPAICVSFFILNFETNQRLAATGRSNNRLYMRWGVRVCGVVGLYFFQAQPSACFAYWIGMSVAGLLSPVLLRNEAFRRYFNFPERPALAKEQEEISLFSQLLIKVGLKEAPKELTEEEKEKIAREQREKELGGFDSIHNFEVIFEEEEQKNAKYGKGKVSMPTR